MCSFIIFYILSLSSEITIIWEIVISGVNKYLKFNIGGHFPKFNCASGEEKLDLNFESSELEIWRETKNT